MQIRKPVVKVKVAHLSNKTLLVVEHAFPLMGFVDLLALALFGGS